MTRLHRPSHLSSWTRKKQKPETLSLKIPSALTNSGQIVVTVRREQGPNTVLGELWVTEE